MNERERWIVYPLLFFALGAALRDKFLQHVSTKELECQRLVVKQLECDGPIIAKQMQCQEGLLAKQIQCDGGLVCEGVVVLDPDNRSQPLVELGRTEPVPG